MQSGREFYLHASPMVRFHDVLALRGRERRVPRDSSCGSASGRSARRTGNACLQDARQQGLPQNRAAEIEAALIQLARLSGASERRCVKCGSRSPILRLARSTSIASARGCWSTKVARCAATTCCNARASRFFRAPCCARRTSQLFQAMEDHRAIAADDALASPLTKELRRSYLEPLGITSMLDAPIYLEGHIVGVVCHEHVGPRRPGPTPIPPSRARSPTTSRACTASTSAETQNRRWRPTSST